MERKQYHVQHSEIQQRRKLIDLISKEDISFDLLFLDYCMKELTGLETAKRFASWNLPDVNPLAASFL